MAMHTQNVQGDPRSSLLVTQPDTIGDPLGASRVNVARKYSAGACKAGGRWKHGNSTWLVMLTANTGVDFDDFSFYQMCVVDVYYVGGFGVMGWVSASEYCGAQADPLADTAAAIMQHMNTDHQDGLVLLAKAFSGIESQEVTMSSVDRLGFHVRLKTQDGMRGVRIAFLREVSSPAEARQVLVEMVAQARRM